MDVSISYKKTSEIRFCTHWNIPLQTLADQGLNLTDMDEIVIGLGSKFDFAIIGGTGMMYTDDIRLQW